MDFTNRNERMLFLRKVYLWLSFQLSSTFVSMAAIKMIEVLVIKFFQEVPMIFVYCLAMLLASVLLMLWFRHVSPIDKILLVHFTILASIVLGTITIAFTLRQIILAICITVIISLIMIFASFETQIMEQFIPFMPIAIINLIALGVYDPNMYLRNSKVALIVLALCIHSSAIITFHLELNEVLVSCNLLYVLIMTAFFHSLFVVQNF